MRICTGALALITFRYDSAFYSPFQWKRKLDYGALVCVQKVHVGCGGGGGGDECGRLLWTFCLAEKKGSSTRRLSIQS